MGAASSNSSTSPPTLQQRCDTLGSHRPDIVLLAPYMLFLLLLAPGAFLPPEATPVLLVARGVLPLVVVWLLRRSLPPLGRPYYTRALTIAVFVGWGWIVGQYAADYFGLGGRLPLFPGERSYVDPRHLLGSKGLFWSVWGLRLLVACTTVPIVEELFWRGFLLRAFVNYAHFEQVPLGAFTWFSFLATSLLSAVQHPDNWIVSILCWFVFNGLMYWTKSIRCLVICNGATNCVLYILTLRVDDWSFF